jgi:hypothetical protein
VIVRGRPREVHTRADLRRERGGRLCPSGRLRLGCAIARGLGRAARVRATAGEQRGGEERDQNGS